MQYFKALSTLEVERGCELDINGIEKYHIPCDSAVQVGETREYGVDELQVDTELWVVVQEEMHYLVKKTLTNDGKVISKGFEFSKITWGT